MTLAKRLIFFIFSFLLIFFIAFWGFKNNFPSKSIAHYLQSNITKQIGFPIEINDLELEWQKISTDRISIFLPKWLTSNNQKPIFVVENIELFFLSIFTTGKIILSGEIHDGKIKISNDIFSKKDMELSLDGLKLQKIPFLDSYPYGKLSGNLKFSANIINLKDLRNEKLFFPKGQVSGKIIDSKIIFSGGSTSLDFQFPELDFSEIFFDFEIGNLITIKRLELKGLLEGNIDGSIQLDKARPPLSKVNINLTILPSPIIKEQMQSLTPILNPFQCKDTIKVNIKGTISRIKFPTKNKC